MEVNHRFVRAEGSLEETHVVEVVGCKESLTILQEAVVKSMTHLVGPAVEVGMTGPDGEPFTLRVVCKG